MISKVIRYLQLKLTGRLLLTPRTCICEELILIMSLDVLIIIASDDVEWCRKNIHYQDVRIILIEDRSESYVRRSWSLFYQIAQPWAFFDLQLKQTGINAPTFDMVVLSMCDHVLYDYGTYGFWTGFLSKGMVFLPRRYKVCQCFFKITMEQDGSLCIRCLSKLILRTMY